MSEMLPFKVLSCYCKICGLVQTLPTNKRTTKQKEQVGNEF